MDKKINLVLASDDNYAQHAAVALMSACENVDMVTLSMVLF